jgi:cytochrome c6
MAFSVCASSFVPAAVAGKSAPARRPHSITGGALQEQRFRTPADLGRAIGSGLLMTGMTLLATSFEASAADIALGRTVFNNNCAACHQGGNNSVIPEKTLRKDAITQYLTGGFNIEAITYQVENGKGAMPAWADRLDEDEIAAVAAYVFETASNNAWDKE